MWVYRTREPAALAMRPDVLIDGVIQRLRDLGAAGVSELDGEPENMVFALPKDRTTLRVRWSATQFTWETGFEVEQCEGDAEHGITAEMQVGVRHGVGMPFILRPSQAAPSNTLRKSSP